MKKLKLNVEQIQVLSFTVQTPRGGGTVNAYGAGDFDDVNTFSPTSGTYVQMSCASSCPEYYCFDANTNPDYCGG